MKMLRQLITYVLFTKVFAFLAFISLSGVVGINPGSLYPPTKGNVWPKPRRIIQKSSYFSLSPAVFKFKVLQRSCPVLMKAIDRYSEVLKRMHHIARRHSRHTRKHLKVRSTYEDPNFMGVIHELNINLMLPCEEYPHSKMKENYTLVVAETSKLTSISIWGVLRGLETFVQLFYTANGSKVFINSTSIEDFPKYSYRGLLIDTSRHYLSVSTILTLLDGMEMNKMNVLHWHIVDDPSFPYQSEMFPQLSEQGAYDSTMVYNKKDIKQIIDYARNRGIRVIPEFDVPGHVVSWGQAYPNILTKCYINNKVIGMGPLDPTNNATYKLLRDLFHEVQAWFPDRDFHVGGDEVDLSCWLSNPEIRKFMNAHNMTSAHQLHSHFMSRVVPLLQTRSRVVVWEEVFNNGVGLPKDALVQVWKIIGTKEMVKILSAGYDVLYSASFYLDQLHSGGDWKQYYTADPRQMITKTKVPLHRILGGVACMWGEVVDDTNAVNRIWPRTSAVAEVLWSGGIPNNKLWREISCRLEEHTCRMLRRGVRAQPPNGAGFCVV